MPKGHPKMNAVTQYKLHKFLTDLSEKDDLDVYVPIVWKQRLIIVIAVLVGLFLGGPVGGAIGPFIGYCIGHMFMNRKYKALQILQKMDATQREHLHEKGKSILGDTDLKTLQKLAKNDSEAKDRMVQHLQDYLIEVIRKENQPQKSDDVSVV